MIDSDRIRLQHMLDAAQEALEFVSGRNREDLNTDRMLLRALIKDIEIIGEAANKVSEEYKNNTPNLPWQDIIDMRNRLIHVYFRINLNIVWQTVKDDLPFLIKELNEIINSAAPDSK